MAYPWKLGRLVLPRAQHEQDPRLLRPLRRGRHRHLQRRLPDGRRSAPTCPTSTSSGRSSTEGAIICWGYAFVHSSDIGGTVPASVWPRATEIFQEGLRLRPTKLYRAGVLSEDVRNLIVDNCRIPEMNWGDIKAMVAAVNSCDRRVQAMVAKFGLDDGGRRGSTRCWTTRSSGRARRSPKIPDGTYRFTDYMEDDLRSRGADPHPGGPDGGGRLAPPGLHGHRPPGRVGAQHRRATAVTHPFMCQAINAYIVTEDPDIPKASSILRPVRVTAPAGHRGQHPVPGADRRPLRDGAPRVRRGPRRPGPGRCPAGSRRRPPGPSRRWWPRSSISGPASARSRSSSPCSAAAGAARPWTAWTAPTRPPGSSGTRRWRASRPRCRSSCGATI